MILTIKQYQIVKNKNDNIKDVPCTFPARSQRRIFGSPRGIINLIMTIILIIDDIISSRNGLISKIIILIIINARQGSKGL
jgi:hypothetical protein